MRQIFRAALVPLVLAAALPNSASALMFDYVSIDGPLGGDTYAIGINNAGQILVDSFSPRQGTPTQHYDTALYVRGGELYCPSSRLLGQL